MDLAAGAVAEPLPETFFKPQSGPQQLLLDCPYEDIFFGGARGGGKTYGMLLEWIQHAQDYGKYATGVFFRKVFKNLEEVIAEAHRIFPGFGGKWEQQSATYVFRSGRCAGARLKFRHLQRDDDADAYQGHAYCVGVGTPILMADGSYKAIELVGIGELVLTLEGPKRVTAKVEPYLAPCVRALVRAADLSVVGSQIHPVWHPTLSASGWRAWSTDDRTDYRASGHGSPNEPPPGSLTFPATLHEPALRSALSQPRPFHADATQSHSPCRSASASSVKSPALMLASHHPQPQGGPAQSKRGRAVRLAASARAYARLVNDIAPGSTERCLIDSDSGDALALGVRESAQAPALSRADVEAPRRAARSDGTGTTPKRNRPHQRTYPHPYSGEARRLSEPVVEGTVELTPCGDHLVADLTVEDANHYITAIGLVNKNTWICFEEMTQWADPTPIDKLRATLRSAYGVHCVFRATGNPGGAGHNWVKARYISPWPKGNRKLVDPETGERRIFIPSLLEDNRILMLSDPLYEHRLKRVGTAALIKAWRFGDWDIVAGGFFDDLWDASKIIMPQIDVPASWTRRRSFDWGSAKPGSLGLWAISDGLQPRPRPGQDLPYFPRGSFLRFGEWYIAKRDQQGQTVPNVGLRMSNETMGAMIAEKTRATNWSGDVADPAIFTEAGGESVYQQLQKGAKKQGQQLNFDPADNTRIAGWALMRNMMDATITGDLERPGLFVTETCLDFIRTVPVLQADKTRPDDVDSDGEDHIGDETRYAINTSGITGGGSKGMGTAVVHGR